MPTNSVGYSFAPTFDNAEMGRRGGSPPASSQQALEVLNFRLKPRVAGAPMGGFSPLVGQHQAGSSIGQAVLQSVLRTVLGDGVDIFGAGGYDSGMGRDRDPGLPSGMVPGQAPPPVIHPGGDGWRPPDVPTPGGPPSRDERDPPMYDGPSAPHGPPPRDFPPYGDGPFPPLVPDGGETTFRPPQFGGTRAETPDVYGDVGSAMSTKQHSRREVLL